MLYEDARRIAEEVIAALAPQCERIEVAGSIRRREPEVQDIEIVYQSQMAAVQAQLFDVHREALYPLAHDTIERLVSEGVLAYDAVVRRNGPLYKRLIHQASGEVVELFRATAENWGLILALRTGPTEFSKILVSHGWDRGILPPEVTIRDGSVWVRGTRYPVPEEETFFRLLGVPEWPAPQRHPGKLQLFQKAQSTLTAFE